MNTKDELIQYYDDLLRLVLRNCMNQQDAEDLVSDTLLAAFEGRMKSLRADYYAHLLNHAVNLPAHLNSVLATYRYCPA